MNHPGGRKLFFVSIVQRSIPTNGEQASYFREKLDAMRKYLATTGLDYVQKPSDVEAARSGTPHVVIALIYAKLRTCCVSAVSTTRR